jgi:hypothetical protein
MVEMVEGEVEEESRKLLRKWSLSPSDQRRMHKMKRAAGKVSDMERILEKKVERRSWELVRKAIESAANREREGRAWVRARAKLRAIIRRQLQGK